MVPASEDCLSACRLPGPHRRRQGAVFGVGRSACRARTCGRVCLGERWPVLPLLEHDTRYVSHPSFPGAAADEDDAGHSAPPEAPWPLRTAEHLIIRLAGIKRNCARMGAVVSASTQPHSAASSNGDTVGHDAERRRPRSSAETDGAAFGVPFRSTKRGRLRVRRRRRPRSTWPVDASEPLIPLVLWTRGELGWRGACGRCGAAGEKKFRSRQFFSCNRVKILYKQLQNFRDRERRRSRPPGERG